MTQLNKDDYREPISEIDLGKEVIDFTKLSKPEEVVSPLKSEDDSNDIPSIKESFVVEESKPEEVVPPIEEIIIPDKEEFVAKVPSIRESLAPKEEPQPVNIGAFPHIEIKEQEENFVEKEAVIKPEEEPVVEEPVTVSKVEEVVVRENNPLSRKIEITETEEDLVPEPIIEEPKAEVIEEIPVVIESYKEIRDDFWNQVNPSNTKRFEELGLEQTEENRSFLNDLSVKITFLDDDFEDSAISEEEAVLKIKEIKNLLNK